MIRRFTFRSIPLLLTVTAAVALSATAQAQDQVDRNGRILLEPMTTIIVDDMRFHETVPLAEPLTRFSHVPVTDPGASANALKAGDIRRTGLNDDNCPGKVVGTTIADFQTNGSMQDRLVFFEESTQSFNHIFWMASAAGAADTTMPDRGSWYNLLEVELGLEPVFTDFWGARIEDTRTGWPNILDLGNGAVGAISHANDNSPLRFINNSGIADVFAVNTTQENFALWPRAAIDDNGVIHIVYTYNDDGPDLKQNQLGYVHSINLDFNTWTEEIFFTGPNAVDADQFEVINGQGADSYAIDARGNRVIVAYSSEDLWLVTRLSEDNGDTWQFPQLITRAEYSYAPESVEVLENLGGDQVWYTLNNGDPGSDFAPPFTPGNHMDIMLDSDGAFHLVFGMIPTQRRGVGTLLPDGSIDSETAIDTTIQLATYVTTGLAYLYEPTRQIQFMGGAGGVEGTEANPDRSIVSRRFGSGRSRYPQIGMDDNDAVYVVYASPKEGDVQTVTINIDGDQTNGYMSHLYLTHSFKEFEAWSDPVDITPDGVDALFPTMADYVQFDSENLDNSFMFIGYSANETPGDWITTPEIIPSESTIFAFAAPYTLLNTISSVTPTDDRNANLSMEAYPNPAVHAVSLKFTVDHTGPVSIKLYNSLGLLVDSVADQFLTPGGYTVEHTLKTLPTGAYYFILTSNGQQITTPINIVR